MSTFFSSRPYVEFKLQLICNTKLIDQFFVMNTYLTCFEATLLYHNQIM